MNFSTVPPWLLDDRPHALEVGRKQRAQTLGIERLAERGRARKVAEQDGHDLALLAHRGGRRLERGEAPPRSLRRDDIALALVELERLLERSGCFLWWAGELQHLAQGGVGIPLRVGVFGRIRDGDGLVGRAAAPPRNAPRHASTLAFGRRQYIWLNASSLAPLSAARVGPGVCIDVATEPIERLRMRRRGSREEPLLAKLLEHSASFGASRAPVSGSSARSSTHMDSMAVSVPSTTPPPRSASSARVSSRIARASSKLPCIASDSRVSREEVVAKTRSLVLVEPSNTSGTVVAP